jgi:hypothetical protein
MNTHQNRFFNIIGGRKQFNGYIATLLLTVMAPFLKASFPEYSLGILGALGLTSSLIAFEDRENRKNSESTKISSTNAHIEGSGVVGQQQLLEIEQSKGATSNNSHNN